MIAHTIIATPVVWVPFKNQQQSIAGWLQQNIQGNSRNYGLYLVDKTYE